MRFYLVGPMDHDRESGRQWRDEMSDWLFERGAIPLNPYYKPVRIDHAEAFEDDDNYFARSEAIKIGDFDKARDMMKPVIETDLRMVDHSDVLVCNLDLDKRPCGTWDESITAANQNKPVIIRAVQGVKNLPPWMFGRFKHEMFFDEWSGVKQYLNHIDKDDNIDMLGKWKFFDYKPLVLRALGIQEVPQYVGG